MYNHYLDGGSFVLLDPEPQGANRPGQQAGRQPNPGQQAGRQPNPGQQSRPDPGPHHHPDSSRRPNGPYPPNEPPRLKNDLAGDVTRGLGQLLDGLRSRFSLEKLDTGDILLVLIILFLYLEDGDNLELVITLGLLLLLGLGEDDNTGEKKDP